MEVKESLNRPVVGQLIVARNTICRGCRPGAAMQFIAVVVSSDTLIHELCSQIYDTRAGVASGSFAN